MHRGKIQSGLVVLFSMCGLLGLAAAHAVAGGSVQTPVSVKVITPGAPVHSGPGDNYYLTDTLPEGEQVEVYRRRDDGWCAIRPPADSFSWVFASNLQLDDEGLAKVTKDNAASRVGSRLSSHRDVVQVRLHKGETVKVLGKDDAGSETWYKIAPPAGEFRWVAGNCLSIADAADGGGAEESRSVTRASHDEPAAITSVGAATEFSAPPLVSASDAAPPRVTPITNPSKSVAISTATDTPSTFSAPTTKTAATPPSAAASAPSAIASKPDPTPPKADITPVATPSAASPEIAQQLSDLELRLSRMVAEPPATWNTDALQQSAQQLLSKADTAADRDAVKATLAKIDRFGSIQRRSVAITGGGARPGATNGTISASAITALPAVGQTGASASSAASGATGQFDAVGVLRPVVSHRPGAPQFALVDDRGQVVTFITATPDVNLQPYLGRRIGVVGSRGYIPEFHRAHVMAARVTPLGDTVLR